MLDKVIEILNGSSLSITSPIVSKQFLYCRNKLLFLE